MLRRFVLTPLPISSVADILNHILTYILLSSRNKIDNKDLDSKHLVITNAKD